MRRYAITDRVLFSDKSPAPHSSHPDREDSSSLFDTLLDQITLWAAQGIDYIQLREKDLPAAALATLSRHILENLRHTPTKLLINSRADVAIATAAHGVHLTSAPGQLTPAQVRQLYTDAHLPQPIISTSCHTLAEVERARQNADLILFAPVFHKTIAGRVITPGQGLEALHAACVAAAPTPVYALGGVTLQNAPACIEAGATGIAGISLFHSL